MTRRVEIVEVGLRDGLQNEKTLLPTDVKMEFIDRLLDAGCKRMEVASFVNPKLVPAMADSDDIMGRVPRDRGASWIGLALNERGLRRAIDMKCDEINYVMVASEGFGVKNQGATPEESAALFERIAPLGIEAGIPLSATISVAFGDPFDGEVDQSAVIDLAERAAKAGAVELAFGDTIGVADPWSVQRLIAGLRERLGDNGPRLRMHFHDTRNTAQANIFAAIEAGVDVIDASCGGLGGCPFAPNATGNVATEDVVYMLDRAGIETGLDLDKLIETTHWVEKHIGRMPPALLAKAGGFPKSA
ncbi:MAG: hydroxymethylglutaryl-CoA lyase [Euryhalocaulis sp.]|uniref:hydroxymethylglutaryl-CoA lyase n=1 Tax=Euryhalocaulis sp. TaxID=2744307 RepID=UPI00185AB5EC|nr:hydroxymethylglutaryl-CoA lyase [Euryhalocaulis sp.]MBA4800884.1 hydroxymethylglutaryl-CoA lyase [Euryhalocaulis sp.]